MTERNLIAISMKNSDKDCIMFWGKRRTNDNEERSFNGYTTNLDSCELYSEKEFVERYPDVCIDREFSSFTSFWRKYKGKCHTVLVDVSRWKSVGEKEYQQARNYRKRRGVNVLNKGDKVVMHTCLEAKYHNGTVWTCKTDSWNNYGNELVFLEGYCGAFCTEYLQIVKI